MRRSLEESKAAARRAKCFYCGDTPPTYVFMDHVLPEARGGDGRSENLVECCESCNSSKGARTPSEWRSDLRQDIYEMEQGLLAAMPEFQLRQFVPRDAGERRIQLAVHMGESVRERLRAYAIKRGVPMGDVAVRLILEELDRDEGLPWAVRAAE